MIARLHSLLLRRLPMALARLLLSVIPAARRNRPVRRSLWTGAPILTLATNARAESRLGVRADSLVYSAYFITNRFTYNLSWLMRLPILRDLLAVLVFVWACCRYQRFHFYCDYGLLPPEEPFRFNRLELRLLRELGKEVFFWTYGADVRTRNVTEALGRFNCCMDCPAPGRACVCDDTKGARNVEEVRRAATACFAMGDMIEYTPGSRNDLFFWPVDLDADGGAKYAPHYPPVESEGPVRVVHAPNHRHYKGTRYLIEAVERLQAEGAPIELELVEGVPNDEALRLYRTADLIFDQCIVGFHGFFAIEAMAMGKPVMCYIRKPDRYLLDPEECPIVNARADQVLDTLRDLVRDRARLHELGRRGRRYVEKRFTLAAFARRLQRAYRELGVAAS